MASSLEVPKFATEAEEADWWYENREMVEATLRTAIKEGRAGYGTAMRRAMAAQSLVQIDADDAAKARAIAERKGVSYETYMKALVHEALEKEFAA